MNEQELREVLGEPTELVRKKIADRLNPLTRQFVERSPFVVVATGRPDGGLDVSPRGDPGGFVRILDERTLIYPEYRGNGVMASMGNIAENPQVGILMVDFTRDRIGLHVNGRARILLDEEVRGHHPEIPPDPAPGRRARLWVEVTVQEAYIHCAKHIPHMQKVPPQQRAARDWGTDDYRRKGGDFFGAAEQRHSSEHDAGNPERRTGSWSAG